MQENKKPSLLRRMAILSGTVMVVTIAVGAVTLGSNALAQRVENTPGPEAAALAVVSVVPVQFEDHYTTTRRYLGQVEPNADADLSFERGGRLAALNFDEGQRVA